MFPQSEIPLTWSPGTTQEDLIDRYTVSPPWLPFACPCLCMDAPVCVRVYFPPHSRNSLRPLEKVLWNGALHLTKAWTSTLMPIKPSVWLTCCLHHSLLTLDEFCSAHCSMSQVPGNSRQPKNLRAYLRVLQFVLLALRRGRCQQVEIFCPLPWQPGTFRCGLTY